MGVEQFGGFLSRLAEIPVRQIVKDFPHGIDVFHRDTLEFSHAFTPLSHPPARSVLPFPLYAPFFKVANKVCKLL